MSLPSMEMRFKKPLRVFQSMVENRPITRLLLSVRQTMARFSYMA